MNRQNLLTLLATFALLFSFTYSCNAKGKDKAKHVVFIGLDGWGAYSLPKADMPNVKKLMEDGSYTLKKRSALPSSSAITGHPCLWEPDRNFTDIPSGDPKHLNFRRVY